MGSRIIILIFYFLVVASAKGQENVVTFGIQYRPIVPSQFLNSSSFSRNSATVATITSPKYSQAFGMLVRKGLTRIWSLETGINFVQRNYQIDIKYDLVRETQRIRYRYLNYEVPVQALVYVKLGTNLFMNASGGMSLNFYPSDVTSQVDIVQDSSFFTFYQYTFRNRWVTMSLIANYGFEYRSRKSGYYYFGVSYYRPFGEIGQTEIFIKNRDFPDKISYGLIGNFLTVDLRYYFHEAPLRPK